MILNHGPVPPTDNFKIISTNLNAKFLAIHSILGQGGVSHRSPEPSGPVESADSAEPVRTL